METELSTRQKSQQSPNNKRKNLEENKSHKSKKKKTSIEHRGSMKPVCQEKKPKKASRNATTKSKSAKIPKHTTEKEGETVHSVSESDNRSDYFQRNCKGKSKKKGVYPESTQDQFDLVHHFFNPEEAIAKRLGLKKGKWTKKEEKILRENMDRFLKYHNIDDPKKLIFAYQNTDCEEGKKWKQFAKSTDFYRELAKGINRSPFIVYRKALRAYDDSNFLGKYSEFEDQELLRLVAVYGKNWSKIGGMLGRSGMSVSHRHYLIKDKINYGPWQDSEVKSLNEAVRKLTNTSEGEEVYSGINWLAVSLIVKTRNNAQCRKKWLRDLCWKDCKLLTRNREWSLTDDVELIDKIYKSQVTEECDIDWLSLTADFELARSPEWLKLKFYAIKRKFCKSIDFEVVEFEEVIDYLYSVVSIDLQNEIFQNELQE